MNGKINAALCFLLALLCLGCNKKPTASFFTDKSEYAPGETILIANRSTYAGSCKWTFPDGSTSTAREPFYSIPDNTVSGDYTIRLETFSRRGNKKSVTSRTVTIKQPGTLVTFWTSRNVPLTISVDGVLAGVITTAYFSIPSCGASGCVSVELTFGQHTISVESSSSAYTRNIQVNQTGCMLFNS